VCAPCIVRVKRWLCCWFTNRPLRPFESKSATAAAYATAIEKSLHGVGDGDEALVAVGGGRGVGNVRIPESQQLSVIQANANTRDALRQAVEANNAVTTIANETETSLRFYLFMLTLYYFRAMSTLQRLKATYGKSDIRNSLEALTGGPPKTKERLRMEAAERNRQARLKAIMEANGKATAGYAKRSEDHSKRTRLTKSEAQEHVRRKKKSHSAATKIQTAWRAFVARRAFRKWVLKSREIVAKQAIVQAAATAIQSAWRGFVARQMLAERRREMALFLRMVRQRKEKEIQAESAAPVRTVKSLFGKVKGLLYVRCCAVDARLCVTGVRCRCGLQQEQCPSSG
jgi:hypothetical protein